MAAFAACTKDDPNPDDDGGGDDTDKPAVNVTMENVTFRGVVKDVTGALLSDVKVSTGTAGTTTDGEGVFTFTEVGIVENRAVLKFDKSGYFPITRSGVKANEMNLEVVMQPKGNSACTSQETFAAGAAKTLKAGDMQVSLPASSLVKADGSAYTGNVKADIFYLDPNNPDLATLMPGGDLIALRSDDSQVKLITYGMAEVTLTDDSGNPLQLREGAEAEMTYPIPAGKEDNLPATIPLWYFDEDRGIWVEEGMATRNGDAYVGKVTHFSWHNIDTWEGIVTIKGKVTDCKGDPVKYVLVTVDETAALTGSTGDYMVYVPANTPVTVTVRSESYGDYSPVVSYDVPGQPANAIYTRDIGLPCLNDVDPTQPVATIKGTVTDCNDDPVKNVMVRVGQVNAVTGNTGEYSATVPANTPVTVTVRSEDYGDYSPVVSHTVPGQPANAIYTRDISLPCLDNDDPEAPEGSFFATKCARVKYLMSYPGAGSDGVLYYTLVFDDYGKRMRIETETEDGLNIVIMDFIARKYYAYTGEEWMDMTQYIPFDQIDYSIAYQFSGDIGTYGGYTITQTGTETIAGRASTIYTIEDGYTDYDTGQVCDVRLGVWRGVTMLTETCGMVMVAQEAELEIPANSFTPR
jgi:hypothetical protein